MYSGLGNKIDMKGKCNHIFMYDCKDMNMRISDCVSGLTCINCHNCNSLNIEKSLMAPNILNSKSQKLKISENKKYLKVKNKIKKYQKFIKKNFKYVGNNFAYEARSIHYDNKKNNSKGIYGKASTKEIKDLKDEGIKTEIVPWFDEKNN